MNYNYVEKDYEKRFISFFNDLNNSYKITQINDEKIILENHIKNFNYFIDILERTIDNIYNLDVIDELENELNVLFSFITYQPDLNFKEFLIIPIQFIEELISIRGNQTENINYIKWLTLFKNLYN
jgi:hypothetical protein